MVILGIDPGTATTGWGVIQTSVRNPILVGVGIITTPAHTPMAKRLSTIYDDLNELFNQFHPDVVVIEELFFNTNAKTALVVGQARGVALLAAEKFGAKIFSYTPLQVKMAVAGYGRADKKQVQQMVTETLKLDQIPKPDDAADALAIALTHHFSHKITKLKTGSVRK